MLRRGFGALALLACCALPIGAQSGLRTRLTTELFTFGTCGQPLCLDGALIGHGNHFIPAQLAGTGSVLAVLSNAIGTSVANTPVSAASSGTTFQFEGGVPVKTSSSAGPIFGERAQTLGRGRFFMGVNVTGMHFERLRGVRLDNLSFNFTHEDIAPAGRGDPDFENDIIQVRVAMAVDLLVTSVFASWGIVDGVDIGVSVPFVRTSLSGQSVAQILPFGSGGTPLHAFGTDINGDPILTAVATTDGAATGLGDVAARVKINVVQTRKVGVAILGDARFPTGDEENLLGAGKFSGRGMGVVSMRFGPFSPHANIGYTVRDAQSENNGFVANFGFDQLLGSWATMAFDLLSEWQVGDSKLQIPGTVIYTEPYPHTVQPTNIPGQKDNFMSASIGFKFVTARGMTFVANGLIPLRDSGLQPSVIWTGGLEYNF